MTASATQVLATAAGPVELAVAGSGPPVIAVHGSPGGWDQAAAMGRFLVDAGFTVIAPSRPGYLGTPLEGRQEIDAQAGLLAAVLDALGHDRAGLLAWSGGGPCAYRMAVLHPGRVAGLVATAAVSRAYSDSPGIQERLMMNTAPGNWLLRFLRQHAPEQTVGATLGAEGDLTRDELRERVALVMGDPGRLELVMAMVDSVSDRRHRGAGCDNDLAMFAAITSLGLGSVRTPTLVVTGSADTDVDPSYGEHAAATIPGAEHRVLDRGTHAALWVHPGAEAAQAHAAALLRSAAAETPRDQA